MLEMKTASPETMYWMDEEEKEREIRGKYIKKLIISIVIIIIFAVAWKYGPDFFPLAKEYSNANPYLTRIFQATLLVVFTSCVLYGFLFSDTWNPFLRIASGGFLALFIFFIIFAPIQFLVPEQYHLTVVYGLSLLITAFVFGSPIYYIFQIINSSKRIKFKQQKSTDGLIKGARQ